MDRHDYTAISPEDEDAAINPEHEYTAITAEHEDTTDSGRELRQVKTRSAHTVISRKRVISLENWAWELRGY